MRQKPRYTMSADHATVASSKCQMTIADILASTMPQPAASLHDLHLLPEAFMQCANMPSLTHWPTVLFLLCERCQIPLAQADERDYVPVAERGGLRGVLGHGTVSLRHGDPSLDALTWLVSPLS